MGRGSRLSLRVRGSVDTSDIVQETLRYTFTRLGWFKFKSKRASALRAYLRRSPRRTEIAALDTRLSTQIANLDTRLSTQIAGVRTEVANLEPPVVEPSVEAAERPGPGARCRDARGRMGSPAATSARSGFPGATKAERKRRAHEGHRACGSTTPARSWCRWRTRRPPLFTSDPTRATFDPSVLPLLVRPPVTG